VTRSCSRAKEAAHWRSWEAATVAWMVAMLAMSVVGAGAVAGGDGAASVHTGLGVEKPGGEREERRWVAGRMVGRGPRPEMNGGASTGGREPPVRQGDARRGTAALLQSDAACTTAASGGPVGTARLAAAAGAGGWKAEPTGSAIDAERRASPRVPGREREREETRRSAGEGVSGHVDEEPASESDCSGNAGILPPGTAARAAPGSRPVPGRAARRARRPRTATRPTRGSSAASAVARRRSGRPARPGEGRRLRLGGGEGRAAGGGVAREWRLVAWEKKNYTGSGTMLNSETLTLVGLGNIFILGIVGPRPITEGPGRGKP
jgi:hypothetical protein